MEAAAAVPVQAAVQDPVPAVQAPVGWDPYEKQEYIRPANPYETSLIDPWSKEDNSDVGCEDEDRDTKAHQVLRRLQSGQYDVYFANDVYKCPFCDRRLGGTDFNCLMMPAEGVSSCTPKIGEIMNLDAFYAKHKALGTPPAGGHRRGAHASDQAQEAVNSDQAAAAVL